MNKGENLNQLCRLATAKLDDLLDTLNVEYRICNKGFCGKCPVHDGADNEQGWIIYQSGYTVPGFWTCFTHHCEEEYDKNLLGLIKGIRKQGPADAIAFLEQFTKTKCTQKPSVPEQYIQSMQYDILEELEEEEKNYIPRSEARQNLIIPATYYINRGYTKNTLNRYDVGYARNEEIFPHTSNRAVVPIYDDTGTYMVGYSARIIYERCEYCNKYHDSGPCPQYATGAKWKHSEGLHSGDILYNWWSAKYYIKTTGTAIIVEGPGDVWKLEEAGLHNSIAILGSSLSMKQKNKIDICAPHKLILLLDNDEAGQKATNSIVHMCDKLYNMCIPPLSANDIGNMATKQIQKLLFPFVKG